MKKLFFTVLFIRLLLSFLPAMSIDMGAWQAWAMRMVEVGPQNFYSTQIFTDNPPGYLYVFWVIGEIRNYLSNWPDWANWLGNGGFIWLLKLPANLFDLGTGLLIYKIIKGDKDDKEDKGNKWARWGFLLYTLNPAIWFNASVFGQFDGAGAFFGLLAVYLILEKKRIEWSAVALAIAWAIKPQAIAIGPAVGILMIREIRGMRWIRGIGEVVKAAGVFILTTLLLYWPFFPENPLTGVFYVFSRMNNIYFCTTCFAFNFWGIFGNWLDDRVLFLGLPLLWWGIGLAGVGMLGVLRRLGKAGEEKIYSQKSFAYLAIAISIMAFFMLVTRMHERYILPFFAFFLISVILLKSKKLMLFYLFFSGFNLLNVYYPYASYNTNLHLTPGLVIWLGENFRLLSMVGFGSFLVLCWWYFFDRTIDDRKWKVGIEDGESKIDSQNLFSNFNPQPPSSIINHLSSVPKKNLSWSRREIIIVFLLVFVSFLIRLIRLDIPKTYYFDEVYHAFTAEAYARNDPRGYEWWNTPPKGFAYEWLHPPLAKLLQAGSIKVLGDKAFAWRFPGVIFASLTVLLLYIFGRSLFGSKRIGFMAAFFYTFDGLSFTQSRITMNDIYIAFFILLSFYFFWEYWQGRRKLIWTGVALGLAVSTKWTGFYAIPILGGLWILGELGGLGKLGILEKKDLTKKIFLGLRVFIFLPVIIYFLSYSQFWLQGHTWAQFRELHWQTWYYQTHLKATHPYQSGALSWPFMQRPVWYFVEYGGDGGSGGFGRQTIANIYAMGNPVIWWAGLGAIIWLLKVACYEFFHPTLFSDSSSNRHSTQTVLSKGIFVRVGLSKILTTRPFLAFLVVLLGYFGFFLPWAFSPRIMFLYHYLPSLPFLCLALGWGLGKIWERGEIGGIGQIRITGKLLVFAFLFLTFLTFVYFYPQLAAWPVSKAWSEQYFWFGSWR